MPLTQRVRSGMYFHAQWTWYGLREQSFFLKLTLGFAELVVCLKSTLTTFAKNMVSVLVAIKGRKGRTTYMAAFKMRFTAKKTTTVLNTLLGR